MENTRENVVKLLLQLGRNAYDCSKLVEEDDLGYSKELIAQDCSYNDAARLLTDQNYFDRIWKIYNEE